MKKNIIMLECWMPCRLIQLVKADGEGHVPKLCCDPL